MGKNEIDHFILSKLDDLGMKPSPEADRSTLIRRLYLDLTGLPRPAEVNEYLSDQSPDAYEKVVDRLLASDEYAERMTLLDGCRPQDTSVFHDDGPRDMWPWRDWVLNAYRDNKPFDEFTIEQIAGDLLPKHPCSKKLLPALTAIMPPPMRAGRLRRSSGWNMWWTGKDHLQCLAGDDFECPVP